MRRAFLLGATGLLAGSVMPALAMPPAPGQTTAQTTAPEWQPATLPQARQLDLSSPHTGQRYRIFVSVPETAPPPNGHPVLYVLDGNAAFPSIALMARTVARRSKVTGQHAPVVVGIGYASGEDYDSAARARDYTLPAGGKAAKGEGGADLFLDFIEQQLKPLIQATAPVDAQRQALFGHSYGGLLTLHALFTRPAAFQTYIAASPSIWYADRYILSEAAGLAAARQHEIKVLLTVGELEQQAAPPTAKATDRAAILAQKRMVDEARDLAAQLESHKLAYSLEKVRFIELPRENHGSALFPALSRGLEFFVE
jgi:predicted alpha/beta superfamily hydrolase